MSSFSERVFCSPDRNQPRIKPDAGISTGIGQTQQYSTWISCYRMSQGAANQES
jgi:hypothetical protein